MANFDSSVFFFNPVRSVPRSGIRTLESKGDV